MIKKTMTYKDYNGETVTEDFYFGLSKSELMEMEMTAGKDGYSAVLAKIVAEDNREEMLKIFKKIILMSIGRRSEDGRRFIKTDEIRDEFAQTPAFDDLLVSFYTDSNAAVEFFTGVVPEDLTDTMKKSMETVELPDGSEEVVKKDDSAPKTWKDYTRDELVIMSKDAFDDTIRGVKLHSVPAELMSVMMERKSRQA